MHQKAIKCSKLVGECVKCLLCKEGLQYLTGTQVQFISDNDLDTKWGRFVESMYDKTKRKEKHRSGGGGIVFTSKYGQGGGPTADFTDAQMENIDLLMDVISQVGDVASIESLKTKITEVFSKKGIDRVEAATIFVLEKFQEYIKQKTDRVKENMESKENVDPIGSDSCTSCNRVEPKDSMNNHADKSQNYHPNITKTKTSHKVQKDKAP